MKKLCGLVFILGLALLLAVGCTAKTKSPAPSQSAPKSDAFNYSALSKKPDGIIIWSAGQEQVVEKDSARFERLGQELSDVLGNTDLGVFKTAFTKADLTEAGNNAVEFDFPAGTVVSGKGLPAGPVQKIVIPLQKFRGYIIFGSSDQRLASSLYGASKSGNTETIPSRFEMLLNR